MSPLYQSFPTVADQDATRRYGRAFTEAPITTHRAETFPRIQISGASAVPTAGAVFGFRISLVPKAYTTVSVNNSGATTPATLVNCFVGLYDANGASNGPSARLATTTDQAADDFFTAAAEGIYTCTLNYTSTAYQDVFLCFLIGSFATAPTYRRSGSGIASAWQLDPMLAFRTSATNLTSLPDPIGTLTATTQTLNSFWLRYE